VFLTKLKTAALVLPAYVVFTGTSFLMPKGAGSHSSSLAEVGVLVPAKAGRRQYSSTRPPRYGWSPSRTKKRCQDSCVRTPFRNRSGAEQSS
jgi:hypothetical protein